MFKNYNHGDLHPGNWKLRETNDTNPKLIVYDFGYCWNINKAKFKLMGNTLNDTFEGSNKEDYENCFANLCDCMYFIIINDNRTK